MSKSKSKTKQRIQRWDRPDQFEDYTLFQLNLTHKFVKNRWNKCKQENVVRIFPYPSALHEGPQWKEFCRAKILLHVRHRDLQQLTENAWSALYDRHIEEINSDPIDLLGPAVD